MVFSCRVAGQPLEFGTTGKRRYSDLVMCDRQREIWRQPFTGEAIVGRMIGQKLRFLPARLESYPKFKARAPRGEVLVPSNPGLHRYGMNPYGDYNSSHTPFLYQGKLPEVVAPLAGVVAVGNWAWSVHFFCKLSSAPKPRTA